MIKNRYIVLFLALPLFCSCSKEAGEEVNPNAPAGLDARIAGVSLVTRGGAATASDISTLGIYAVNSVSTETAYGTAPSGTYCEYKIDKGVASPKDAAAPLWLYREKATIFSCHPAPSSASDIASGGTAADPVPTVKIPAAAIGHTQSAIATVSGNVYDFADAAHDYMYGVAYDDTKSSEAAKYLATQPVADNGHAGTGTSGPKVAIGLKHAFAQIKLIISKDAAYKGDAKITQVTYTRKMKTLKSDGSTTMSLKDGTLANTADLADKVCSFAFAASGGVATTEATGDKAAPVILVNYVLPNAASKSTFSVTVDGKAMTMQHDGDPKWEAGNIYSYTITIKPTGLVLTGFTVIAWKDESQPDIPTI